MKDYFSILGVRPGATQDDIKKAYRKLALRLHPDVNNSPDANERFREITEAYQFLTTTQQTFRFTYPEHETHPTPESETRYSTNHHHKTQNKRSHKTRPKRPFKQKKTEDKISPIVCKYLVKMARFGIFLSILLAIDWSLPGKHIKGRVSQKHPKADRHEYSEFSTDRYQNVQIFPEDFYKIFQEMEVELESSFFLGIRRKIVYETVFETVESSLPENYYNYFWFMPIIFFVFSYATLKMTSESNILQFGSANAYLLLIGIIILLNYARFPGNW